MARAADVQILPRYCPARSTGPGGLQLIRRRNRRGGRPRNGLARLAGTGSQEDMESFEAAIEATERVDDELWR